MRCSTLGWLVVALLAPLGSRADEPPVRRHEVISPKDDGINAAGINARGDLTGFEWAPDPEHEGVIGQEPFFARGKVVTRLPLLPTYTATMPAAVSDAGLVVGRVAKPLDPRGRVMLQNQAFTWTEADGIRGLGALPDDFTSMATGVSADGQTICGVSIGDNRVRACVWKRSGSGSRVTWRGIALPQTHSVASHYVAISPDGCRVVGLDGGVPTLWSCPNLTDPTWTRESLGLIGSFNPRAVNNAGSVAAIIFPADGSTHAAIWTRAQGVVQPIPEPPTYTRSEANAINAAGAVVGMIDGPAGSPVSPRAFVFEDGRLRILDEGGPNFVAATAINDAGQVAGAFEKEEAPEPAPPAKPVTPAP